MNKNLFDDSDDNLSEENFQINTNESYAKSYNNLRKKELLQKYKNKGLNVSESDPEDSSSSDEDEILDPTFDKEFLKTLASLKSKDPVIYNKSTTFFKTGESSEDSAEKHVFSKKDIKSKPVTLKDYERKIILEKGGKFADDSDIDEVEGRNIERPSSPSMAEEERRLKAEFKKVMCQENDSSDEEFGRIFKKRQKSKIETDKEEEDYLKWLAGKKESIEDDVKEKLEPLKNYWSSDKLPSREKFLRDYVLNKGYTEAKNYREIPTYEEIVGDEAHLSEDEQELEKQAEFEQKYNFRYEEPDQEFIKRYPRTIESSLRLTDDARKRKRQEIKERKLQEKQQKLKELDIVKEMKRKEIKEKIEMLKMVTGNDELGFKDDDLEEDFDPDAHDRRMKELFNEDYYQVDEGEEKPECPSDIEDLKVEDWDNYNPQQEEDSPEFDSYEPHCEDDDFIMDCDYDPTKAREEMQKELVENTKKRRSGRKGRRNRFMEIIKSEKPPFDPEDEKTYGEYIDEYYKLDCEDIIGDTPCRFKYVETTPNDFGLTIEEILSAKNKELNQWASLKKAIQIRPEYVEKKEQRLFKLKARNEELKRKIFKSLYGGGSDNENDDDQKQDQKDFNKNQSMEMETGNENSMQAKNEEVRKQKKHTIKDSQAGSEPNSEVNNANDKKINTVDDSSFKNEKTETKQILVKQKKKKKKNKNKSKIQPKIGSNEETSLDIVASNAIKNPFNRMTKKATNNENKIFENFKNAHETTTFSSNSKSTAKRNPFANSPKNSKNETMPPFGKNVHKLNDKSKIKFKSKFQNKKPFNGKNKTKEDTNSISDERLKAYGINPKKFHKKQKYGSVK